MRLVFVDGASDRVRGDTAVFAVGSQDWMCKTSTSENVEELALTAARILDEVEGRSGCVYQFAQFWPTGKSGGYDVFQVAESCGFAETCTSLAPRIAVGSKEGGFADFLTRCHYVGYVHRAPLHANDKTWRCSSALKGLSKAGDSAALSHSDNTIVVNEQGSHCGMQR